MTYRDLIRLYQEGSLTGADLDRVETDIERHVAISDYLYEHDFPEDRLAGDGPGPDEGLSSGDASGEATHPDQAGRPPAAVLPDGDPEFTRMIRKSIRRAFFRMGIIVGCAVLVLLLALPHVVSLPFYNPDARSKVASDEVTGYVPNRFGIDLAVYDMLFLPGQWAHEESIVPRGYGNYDISVYVSRFGGDTESYGGRIERNRLIMYHQGILQGPFYNCFEWNGGWWNPRQPLSKQVGIRKESYTVEGDDTVYWETRQAQSMAGDRAESKELLRELPEEGTVTAYLSFDSILSYEETRSLMEKYGISLFWMGIYPYDREMQFRPIGLPSEFSGAIWNTDQEKYPYLLGYSYENDQVVETFSAGEQAYTAQFTSMLKYLAAPEQSGVRKLFGIEDNLIDNGLIGEILEYVEKNGLQIHGVAINADKELLLQMIEDPAVYSIATE